MRHMSPGLVVGFVVWLSWGFGPVFLHCGSAVSLSCCRLVVVAGVLGVFALCPCVLPASCRFPPLVLAFLLFGFTSFGVSFGARKFLFGSYFLLESLHMFFSLLTRCSNLFDGSFQLWHNFIPSMSFAVCLVRLEYGLCKNSK